ncbi:SDR family oxidoreductase [soil metagenome]
MSAYFISGASSGIGRELARRLVARGDRVAVAARRLDELEALAAELADLPGQIHIFELDVTDSTAVERIIRSADSAVGGLDVVVVNAGRGGGKRIGTGGFDENRALLDTNLTGALAQMETAVSLFRSRGRGHLVLVSSLAGWRGLPGSAAVYSASKAALASLGESLRIELATSGIDVTVLRPGYIDTPLLSRRGWLVTSLPRGIEAIMKAIDRRASDVGVPSWPWRPVGWILRRVPENVLRRFS